MNADIIVEPILAGLALLIFILYHVYLLLKIRKHPMKMAAGQNEAARLRWVENIMATSNYIVGVQTIRNTMMASSLLASTSIALSSVIVAFLAQSGTFEKFQGISLFKSPTIAMGQRFFVVILFPSIAFFCYMQSIRAGNHASYLIGIPYDPFSSFYVTPTYVAKVLRRGAIFYTIGTRFYYLAFLALLWLFGPLPPIIASAVMVAVLYKTDQYPDIHEPNKNSWIRPGQAISSTYPVNEA